MHSHEGKDIPYYRIAEYLLVRDLNFSINVWLTAICSHIADFWVSLNSKWPIMASFIWVMKRCGQEYGISAYADLTWFMICTAGKPSATRFWNVCTMCKNYYFYKSTLTAFSNWSYEFEEQVLSKPSTRDWGTTFNERKGLRSEVRKGEMEGRKGLEGESYSCYFKYVFVADFFFSFQPIPALEKRYSLYMTIITSKIIMATQPFSCHRLRFLLFYQEPKRS